MSDLATAFHNWRAERNASPSDQTSAIDAKYAADIGLPTLAALCQLLARLERANGPISPAEMIAEVRPIVSIARGEATVRIGRAGGEFEVPGLPTISGRLVEDLVFESWNPPQD